MEPNSRRLRSQIAYRDWITDGETTGIMVGEYAPAGVPSWRVRLHEDGDYRPIPKATAARKAHDIRNEVKASKQAIRGATLFS